MPLRPALKAQMEQSDTDTVSSPFPFACSNRVLDSPRVHFPPTPTLTTTALTHSPNVYDRAPIHVAPNTCALPERGARMYFVADGSESAPRSAKECYFQTRRPGPIHSIQAWTASESASRSTSHVSCDHYERPTPPILIHDCSSESEGSDGVYGSPGAPSSSPNTRRVRLSNTSSRSDDELSASGCNDFHRAVKMQSELAPSFSLLPCPPPTITKPKSKSGLKKKKDRPLVDEGRRTTTYSTVYDNLCDPRMAEGCLGGF